MDTNLMQASKQWSKRAPDERFWDLHEMAGAVEARKAASKEITAPLAGCNVVATDTDNLALEFAGGSVVLSKLATEQFTKRVGFLPSALPLLSTGLAAQVLNERIVSSATDAGGDDREVQALIDTRTNTVRAITSEKYSRLWDTEVVGVARQLESLGFKVPPGRPTGKDGERTRIATEQDCIGGTGGGGLAINPGDTIAPSGLYAGDRDMFALLVNPMGRGDGGDGSEFMRAVMIGNSEVGTGSFTLTTCLVREVCGNHILWGCREILNLSRRHIGNIGQALETARQKLLEISGASIQPDLEVIGKLRTLSLGSDAKEVMDRVYRLRVDPAITQGVLADAMGSAEKWRDQDGDPYSAWGVINGLTRVSQGAEFADERVTLDRAAGKLMAVLSK